jgi:hypothetical protein
VLFARVPEFPILEQWLRNGEDVPSDYEAWGVQKKVYQFDDLRQFYQRQPGVKKKVKKEVKKEVAGKKDSNAKASRSGRKKDKGKGRA